jgi:hypothetical protein
MQNSLHDNLATSLSSSRSRWNTKSKRDAAAPPIWLRRVLNDATNVDVGSLGNENEISQIYTNNAGDHHCANHGAARDRRDEARQWQQPPAAGINSGDASDLYLNPLAFSNNNGCSHQSRQGPCDSSALLDEGSYASIHAAVGSVNLGSRAVQSARRTRASPPHSYSLLQHLFTKFTYSADP